MKLLHYLDSKWRSMGIVRKFAVALGSLLALILLVAVVGVAALSVLEKKAGEIVADSMRMQRLALEMDSRLQLARQAERDFCQRIGDLGLDGARMVFVPEFTQRLGEAGRNAAWLQDMRQFSSDSQAGAVRLEELGESIRRYGALFEDMVELAGAVGVGDQSFARTQGEMEGEYLHLISLVRQLAVSATDGARNAHDEIARSSALVRYVLMLSVLLALLLAASIFWVLNRSVARSVVQLSNTATELSLGNLEARAIIGSDDEFGRLADSINAMAHRITALINDLEGRAAMASDRLVDAIDSISEGFLLYDNKERLIIANRRAKEVAGCGEGFFKPGLTVEQISRLGAESGLFVSALGREDAWVEERLKCHRTISPPVEELLSDGSWVQVKTYRSGRGETVVVFTDVTERKRKAEVLATMNSDLEDLVRERTKVLVEKAMELRQANRRLMELDELKSAFLSSVSHELRTPLTSLLGFSKIIRRDFTRTFMHLADTAQAQRLGERIQSNLDIIGSEGERLTRLINDVLDLSRIESGQEDWRFTEIDLAGCVNRAVSAASGLLSPKPQVRLTIRRMDPVPLVHADQDRIHQVLMNLLSNAVKFTDFGEVAVDLYLDDQGMARIRVEDTGRGIKARYLEQIFDKFHQVHRGDTLTEKPAGTGLGLAISRQIVEHYHGRIWAESKLGRGTVMNVALPPADPADRPLVLVVDDDPAARDYLSMLLKKEGYGVHAACDGEQALTLAAARRPALITMDILMPGMDGRTAIRTLRRDRHLADIPILVVSVFEGCHMAGGDAALVKPVNGDAFIGAVHALIGDGGPARPVLALGSVSAPESCRLAGLCGESVIRCSEVELWALLDDGFEGTVVMPESMADAIDLPRICGMTNVQVLLLPGNGQTV
ncbi:MAG: response regulator [Pseudodesulfovibrio sp.]|nr:MULTISPECIES: ATP-binding protein [Pseudodesulfovibrio]MBU4191435.1 response regulator [Pseudomonadota bacterium]MBU4243601.1 response regulator [Pseudomonadota bacterium]MBU4380389.1 response regulator [Pseudomonadota bacterium]MBU4475742.1 response regulator [Pseudomonadota bacterium]MBU4516663.1 response regulator [Pseudomonadota bacterium]